MEDDFEGVRLEGKKVEKVLYWTIEEKENESLRTKALIKRVESYLSEKIKR